MSKSKKYESFGVDRDQQVSKPTLVEKARQEENELKRHAGLASPEQIEDANSKDHYDINVSTDRDNEPMPSENDDEKEAK